MSPSAGLSTEFKQDIHLLLLTMSSTASPANVSEGPTLYAGHAGL